MTAPLTLASANAAGMLSMLTAEDAALFAAPLQLADGSHLQVLEVKRYLPGRRLVGRAIWVQKNSTQNVFVKVFYGQAANKYAARDAAGVKQLMAKQIATPPILAQCATLDAKCEVLILQEIQPAENVDALWHRLPLLSEARLALVLQLVQTVAEHHKAGLMQTDLYFKNFIKQNAVMFTLDGDGIVRLPTFNAATACLKNICRLLSKLDALECHQWLAQCMAHYQQASGLSAGWTRSQYETHIAALRLKNSHDYADKKVFRTCTDVILNVFSQTHFLVARAYAPVTALHDVVALDAALVSPAFKSGNTCTVGVMDIPQANATQDAKDHQKIVIKRYNIKSIWHAMNRSVRKTRAAASWANAHRLILLGLPTAMPIALLEKRAFFGLLKKESYFLSTFVDAPDVAEYFASEHDKVKRAAAVKQLVLLFYRLYLLKLSHGDMKASNIKMVNHQPVLIDLDSMQQHQCAWFGASLGAWFAKRKHARDLKRFMRNWTNGHQQDVNLARAFMKVFKVIYADHAPLKLANIE